MLNLTEYAKNRYSEPPKITRNYLDKLHQIARIVGNNNQVLELGSGAGDLTKLLKARDNKVMTVDLDHSMMNVDLQKGKLPIKRESYDTVVAVEIIEHILDVDSLLYEIWRVLEPLGRLIISTPNLASLGRRLMLLVGSNPYVENFLYPDEAGHVKHYTAQDLDYLLTRRGFKDVEITGDVVNLTSNGRIYSTWLAKRMPTLARCIIAVARKS